MTHRVWPRPSIDTQDTGSYATAQNMPSYLAAVVLAPSPGHRILDMCAAPGGKTAALAQLMGNNNKNRRDKGEIVALEIRSNRMEALKKATEQYECVECRCLDGNKAPEAGLGQFDGILLDAPCSSLGQRPWRRPPASPASIASFPILQKRLMASALKLLKPGGELVFDPRCHCRRHQDGSCLSQPEDPTLFQPSLNFRPPPSEDDTIGFFIAKLKLDS